MASNQSNWKVFRLKKPQSGHIVRDSAGDESAEAAAASTPSASRTRDTQCTGTELHPEPPDALDIVTGGTYSWKTWKVIFMPPSGDRLEMESSTVEQLRQMFKVPPDWDTGCIQSFLKSRQPGIEKSSRISIICEESWEKPFMRVEYEEPCSNHLRDQTLRWSSAIRPVLYRIREPPWTDQMRQKGSAEQCLKFFVNLYADTAKVDGVDLVLTGPDSPRRYKQVTVEERRDKEGFQIQSVWLQMTDFTRDFQSQPSDWDVPKLQHSLAVKPRG